MSAVDSPSELTPVLSLNVAGRSPLILNFGRETISGTPQMRIRTHEKTRSLTLLLDGLPGDDYGFDVITALRRGLLQLLDAESKDVLAIPPIDTLPRARTIKPMEISQNEAINFHPRHEFWKQLVKNGNRYLIRFSESGGLSWCQYGPKEEHYGCLERGRPESLHVRRGSDVIEFTVRDDPPPPTFSASVSTSSDICHLSAGSPKFELIISITSHESRPITVAIEDSPFYIEQTLDAIFDIQDQDSNEKVEMPLGVGCSMDNTDSDDYPNKLILQEFLPGEPYVRKYALEPFDEATANGGELEYLTEGHRYSVRPTQTITEGFSSWCFGRKSELPGEPKEIRRRLENNGRIRFAVTDVPVFFKAEN
jgi:hypothetical protein